MGAISKLTLVQTIGSCSQTGHATAQQQQAWGSQFTSNCSTCISVRAIHLEGIWVLKPAFELACQPQRDLKPSPPASADSPEWCDVREHGERPRGSSGACNGRRCLHQLMLPASISAVHANRVSAHACGVCRGDAPRAACATSDGTLTTSPHLSSCLSPSVSRSSASSSEGGRFPVRARLVPKRSVIAHEPLTADKLMWTLVLLAVMGAERESQRRTLIESRAQRNTRTSNAC